MFTAAAIIIGDEILAGRVSDQNSPLVAQTMRRLGVSLDRIVIIRDTVEEIATEVSACSQMYQYVITSGGIGPTHDDCTMAGIARAFSVPVVRHPALEKIIRDHYGPALPDAALKMAEVPEGARLIKVDGYPTPAIRNVFILPGVPQLFARKLRFLENEIAGQPIHTRQIHLASDESAIAESLSAVANQFLTVKIGSYPEWDTTPPRVLITLESRDAGQLDACITVLLGVMPPNSVLKTE